MSGYFASRLWIALGRGVSAGTGGGAAREGCGAVTCDVGAGGEPGAIPTGDDDVAAGGEAGAGSCGAAEAGGADMEGGMGDIGGMEEAGGATGDGAGVGAGAEGRVGITGGTAAGGGALPDCGNSSKLPEPEALPGTATEGRSCKPCGAVASPAAACKAKAMKAAVSSNVP
jgi:hypothetical protein